MRFAVACATTGVIRIRLNRRVTCRGEFPPVGFTALHEPVAMAEYSPPGAFGGGVGSTVAGGLTSVMYSHAELSGGSAVVTGPGGDGPLTPAPDPGDGPVAATATLALLALQ